MTITLFKIPNVSIATGRISEISSRKQRKKLTHLDVFFVLFLLEHPPPTSIIHTNKITNDKKTR